MKNKWTVIPSSEQLNKVIDNLKRNNFEVTLVENGEDAKKEALKLIPKGAEVMTMTSTTNVTIGLDEELNESGNYNPVRDKLYAMDRKTHSLEMQKLGAAPEYVTGSVHAVTEDGHLLIASRTGSQLGAEAYGSLHVIFVVSIQKIVKDTAEGIKRTYEYCLPLESERARKAYGVTSEVAKILIYNKEVNPKRVHIILVREQLGF